MSFTQGPRPTNADQFLTTNRNFDYSVGLDLPFDHRTFLMDPLPEPDCEVSRFLCTGILGNETASLGLAPCDVYRSVYPDSFGTPPAGGGKPPNRSKYIYMVPNAAAVWLSPVVQRCGTQRTCPVMPWHNQPSGVHELINIPDFGFMIPRLGKLLPERASKCPPLENIWPTILPLVLCCDCVVSRERVPPFHLAHKRGNSSSTENTCGTSCSLPWCVASIILRGTSTT